MLACIYQLPEQSHQTDPTSVWRILSPTFLLKKINELLTDILNEQRKLRKETVVRLSYILPGRNLVSFPGDVVI